MMYDYNLTKLRAIACIMVVLLHCAALDFYAFSSKWSAVVFYDSITRVAVPLFFMLSGATLLAKQEPLITFLKKRFIRIIPALVFWTIFYLIYFYTQGITFYWPALFYVPVSSHLWYLYAVIGIYLVIPIIKRFVQNASVFEVVYYLSLWAIVVIGLWCVSFVTDIDVDLVAFYQLYPLCGYMGYVVLGYLLYNKFERNNSDKTQIITIIRKVSLVIFILSVALIYICTYLLSKHEHKPTQVFMLYLNPLVIIASATFFYYMLQSKNKNIANNIMQKLVDFIAKYSFGIYCIHSFVLEYIVHLNIISRGISEWIYLPILTIIVLVLSAIIVRVMGLIKPLTYVI